MIRTVIFGAKQCFCASWCSIISQSKNKVELIFILDSLEFWQQVTVSIYIMLPAYVYFPCYMYVKVILKKTLLLFVRKKILAKLEEH